MRQAKRVEPRNHSACGRACCHCTFIRGPQTQDMHVFRRSRQSHFMPRITLSLHILSFGTMFMVNDRSMTACRPHGMGHSVSGCHQHRASSLNAHPASCVKAHLDYLSGLVICTIQLHEALRTKMMQSSLFTHARVHAHNHFLRARAS